MATVKSSTRTSNTLRRLAVPAVQVKVDNNRNASKTIRRVVTAVEEASMVVRVSVRVSRCKFCEFVALALLTERYGDYGSMRALVQDEYVNQS